MIAMVALTSVSSAAPVAAKQRIAITSKAGIYSFVLTPLTAGALARDAGSASHCCWRHRELKRDGQATEIDDPLTTLTGRRGNLVVRSRILWVDAGNGYTVGTSTWKVVSGTGVYSGIAGGGRGGQFWPSGGEQVTFRLEGFLASD
jgi:hypothetical protein